MHFRLLVLTNKDNAENSHAAREYVSTELGNDATFCSDGGRFGCPVADWFVVGGRWSGDLTEMKLDPTKRKLFYEEFERQGLQYTSREKSEEEQRKKAHALFVQYFPDFKCKCPAECDLPIYRDTYKSTGYEDDAQIVTEEIWDKVLKPYMDEKKFTNEGHYIESEGSLVVCDLDYDQLGLKEKKEIINKKWIVIVDYHS